MNNKRKKIFKLMSLLGTGSILGMVAASCTNTVELTAQQRIKNYANTIDKTSFEIVKDDKPLDISKTLVKDIEKQNFKYKSSSSKLLSDWNYEVEIVDKKENEGSISISATFNKEGYQPVITNNITFDGFMKPDDDKQDKNQMPDDQGENPKDEPIQDDPGIIDSPDASKIKQEVDKLNQDAFIFKKNGVVSEKNQLKASEINNDNVELKEGLIQKDLIEGWTISYSVSNTNVAKGTLDLKLTFNKEGFNPIESKLFNIDGFINLNEQIANKLFVDKMVMPAKYDTNKVSKKVLQLDSAQFKNLVELNKSITVNNITYNNGFTNLLIASLSSNKINANKLNQQDDLVTANDLYLTGGFKFVSLFKEDDSKFNVSYYLEPKDANNPVMLKSKSIRSLEIPVPGIYINDLLPDNVNVTVGSINLENVTFDPKNQSNMEEYKKLAQQENSKYKYDEATNKLTIGAGSDGSKIFNVNPIQIPYIEPNNNDKIWLKAEYYFDGVGIYSDFFRTKIRVKKIYNSNNDNNTDKNRGTDASQDTAKAISDTELLAPYNKMEKFYSLNWAEAPDSNQFFVGYRDQEIHGSENTESGKGKSIIINNESNPAIKSNQDTATNFLFYSRIGYWKSQVNDPNAWIWANTATILHINAKA
ncbi:hypothetical protein [Mycoplasma sp. E35C]|uniref:hypothetical protein n=1 Tax=Mycoplasma sp. E35C TaxID=2801918 RepID=UPI001CA3E457|nr:hypothetical protein [Mycoplasma sp. E35C]QZX49408.1 hypothetical protein JJE79_01520 [Mycoplasma sp. E35C]